MADVKWIKIVTSMFDHRKIKQIESMPDADAVLVIWIKLLCLAGNINESGMIMMTREIPYTDEMLANEFGRPISTVRMALNIFEKFGMIEIINDIYCISNWEKYQNIDGMDKIREQNRIRNIEYRMRKRLSAPLNDVMRDVTMTQRDATEEDIDKEKDREKEKDAECMPGAVPATGPEIISLLLNDKSLFPVYQSHVDEWIPLYPSVDVIQELRKMAGWLKANPTKRKTKSGIMRFINSWLSREQDKGGTRGRTTDKKFAIPEYSDPW